MEKLRLKEERETRELGLKLAAQLVPGSVVALSGDLGTGKTALTKYIAEGLGIKERITSPTFTIVQEYHDGRIPLYHFDVYRINDVEEMFEIGYEEYFFGSGVSVVEWADLIAEIIPKEAICIHITYGQEEGSRIYEIEGLEEGI